MDGPHEIVGSAGNHRHRAVQPKPRETKQPIIREMNERRLLVRPLIETIGGDQTPTEIERFSKRGLDRHGFARGVENSF